MFWLIGILAFVLLAAFVKPVPPEPPAIPQLWKERFVLILFLAFFALMLIYGAN